MKRVFALLAAAMLLMALTACGEETPADEQPTEEAPADEQPGEEAPEGEQPTEEAPAVANLDPTLEFEMPFEAYLAEDGYAHEAAQTPAAAPAQTGRAQSHSSASADSTA